MSYRPRALLVFLGFALIFGLSYLAFDHIDDSYLHNEPEYVLELEKEVTHLTAVRDSLQTVRDDLQEALDKLKSEDSEDE